MSDYYESEESIKDLLELESNEDLKSESTFTTSLRPGEWDPATGTRSDHGVGGIHPAKREEGHA